MDPKKANKYEDEDKNLQAILIENGKIKKIGKNTQILKDDLDTVINLSGKTIMPSFIDTHSHFLL